MDQCVFYGSGIENLNYVVVYVVYEVCDFSEEEMFGVSLIECSRKLFEKLPSYGVVEL